MHMENEIAEVQEQLSESELQAFEKVAKYLPPNVLAEIAVEIGAGQCPFADFIAEICFDIERKNNGAAEFVQNIVNASR